MTKTKPASPLWTRAEIEKVLEARAAFAGDAGEDFTIGGVSIDTRTLAKGDLFVALKGDKLDGHDYLAAAFAAGAGAALVQKGFKRPNVAGAENWPLIEVADSVKALEALGQAARARSKAKIIGVTGSAGKTGTKEMLATAFGALGSVHASKKSYNNHLGVPLTLANLPRDVDYAVFEMGMNHAGEISSLAAQVRPHIAIITTIEPAHIENFSGIEGIADAKAEIFAQMDKSAGAPPPVAILNIDNAHYARLKAAAEAAGITRLVSFGEDEDADTRLEDCALHADSTKITAQVTGQRHKFKLNIPGKHIAMNALAVLSAVKAAGGDVARSVKALEEAEAVTGRGQRHTITLPQGGAPVLVIDESYNANPGSMRAAFEVFAMTTPATNGRRIAVLGDMLELGKDGPRLHAELANPLLKAQTDLLFCCGPQMDALFQALPPDWRGGHAPDSKTLAQMVVAALKPGDVLLVKGSAGSKMAYVVEALKSLTVQNVKPKDHKNAL